MTIAPGTRLDRFDVTGLIGAGGMGAVYRAYDPRLQREVAIKVLPPEFARDPSRVQRFQQEALAISRLAHPNILGVFDVGTHEGTSFIVMELLEGMTLREAVSRGRLPLRKVIDYATQVARGLAAAHAQGVVHRDIKPENLFITRDGLLKILDFGLAKLIEPGDTADSGETLTALRLGPLGTPAYMSPEQARGDRADHRTDLFSLGVVLYELLSGVSPYRRDTAAETMTAILREEPPPLSPSLKCPPALERVVRHCLEKDADKRFQTARDLAFALGSASHGSVQSVTHSSRFPLNRLPFVVVLVTVAGIALGSFLLGSQRRDNEASLEFTAVHRLTDFVGLEQFPAVAPDSKSVAFAAWVDGVRHIFVRLVTGGAPLQVTKDAADHQWPRWSPDGGSIVYFSPAAPGAVQGTIWEIPALGGAPRRIIDSVGGGDLSSQGRLAAFRIAGDQVELISATLDGGDVDVVARFDEPVYYSSPRWSPDREWIAYQRGDGFRWDVFVIGARGGAPRQLTQDNGQIYGLTWLPDSRRIVYSSGRSNTMPYMPTLGLWQVDVRGRATRRVAVADQSYLHPDMRAGGPLAASRLLVQFEIWKYPVAGEAKDNVGEGIRITRQTGQVQTPTVGADANQVAFLSDSAGHANLWVADAASGDLRQITQERDPNVALGIPIWSPDGKQIAFVSSRGNVGLGFGVWVVQPDGGNLRQVAPRGLGAAWSHDSRWLYYISDGSIYRVAADGGAPVRVQEGPARNVVGSDGTSLYFMVDRTLADGTPGFEVRAATPETGSSRVVAHIPARRVPQWQIINPSLSPDGQWLAMPLTDGVTTNVWGLSTQTSEWRQLTDFGDRPTFIARRVSWSVDGKSIFVALGEGDADIVLFEPRLPD